MAKETKVGLLAGLAFIICFAVILANRGAPPPGGVASSVLRDKGLDVTTVAKPAALPGSTGRAARNESTSAPPTRLPSAGQRAEPNPSTEQTVPAPVASGAEVAFSERPSPPPQPGPETSGISNPSTSAFPVNSSLTSHVPASPPSNENSVPTIDERARFETPNAPARDARTADPWGARTTRNTPTDVVASSQQTVSAATKSYTVTPGDTLSKIAAAHLGSRSKNAIQAIFQANRSVLSSEDAILPGMVLSIPEADTGSNAPSASDRAKSHDKSAATRTAKEVSPKAPAKSTDQANPTPVKQTEKESPAYRWYQVKKNDRFASIAREQLGDGSRWKELHALNKDIFPDPSRIREGVRIKLPVTEKGKSSKEVRR